MSYNIGNLIDILLSHKINNTWSFYLLSTYILRPQSNKIQGNSTLSAHAFKIYRFGNDMSTSLLDHYGKSMWFIRILLSRILRIQSLTWTKWHDYFPPRTLWKKYVAHLNFVIMDFKNMKSNNERSDMTTSLLDHCGRNMWFIRILPSLILRVWNLT